jgi:hypothetical protein
MGKSDEMMAIMRQTALKFFPKALKVEVGALPIPHVILTIGDVLCEVRVSDKYDLEDFQEEVWFQFKKLQTSLDMNDVSETPEKAITIDDN